MVPQGGRRVKEGGDGTVSYDGTTPLVHARDCALRFGLDFLLDIHPPTGFTEPVMTSEIKYILRRWLVIADPTNEARSISFLGIMADRIGLADRLEDAVGRLHESVYQFVDIPAEMP